MAARAAISVHRRRGLDERPANEKETGMALTVPAAPESRSSAPVSVAASPAARRVRPRRRAAALVVALAALGVDWTVSARAQAASVTTDKADYAPGETVTISGSGFAAATAYAVPVIRPDGTIVRGDGSFTPGWDTVVTDGAGAFTYLYQLDGIIGTYQVRVYPAPWSGSLAETPLAATTFTDVAGVVDFRQCANQDPTLGTCHWIGSILQTGNSEYYESMCVPQRLVFDNLGTTVGDIHTLTFSHQATKSGIHAYDFLTSYSQAVATAADAGVPFTDLSGQACAAEIGPPASLGATCSSVRNGPNCLDVPVPDDPFVSKDGSTQSRLDAFEALYGNRTIRVCGNSPVTAGSLTLSHSVANGMDTGDSDILYSLSWTSASTAVVVELAAHISLSGNPAMNPLAWGPSLGASAISGGPYHFNLSQLDGGSLGSQDNQIQGGATPTTTSTTTSTSTSATTSSSSSSTTSSTSSTTSSSSSSTTSSTSTTSSSSSSSSSSTTSTSTSSSSSSSSSSTSTSTSTSVTSSTSSSSTSTTSTTSSSTTSTLGPPVCQHFKCYKTRQTNFPLFSPRLVQLSDQFGTSTVTVRRPERLCNPADKNGEGIGDPTVHGMCYRIAEKGFARRDVLVENQFGSQILRVTRPETLCNPAEKDGVPMATAANHLKCYRVRGMEKFVPLTVTAADQFETKTVQVLKPLLLCNPVDKNGEGIEDPACHLVCYRIKDAVGQPPFSPVSVVVEDQFWSETLGALSGECRKVAHLCVPSTKTELP
jgi:hypothetical protein